MVVLDRVVRDEAAGAGALVVGDAGADDQPERIGEREARHTVQGFLFRVVGLVELARAPVRFGEGGRVPVVEVARDREDVGRPVVGIEVLLHAHVAEGGFVLAPAQRKGAAGVQADVLLVRTGDVVGRVGAHAQAGQAVGTARQVEQVGIGGAPALVVDGAHLPAVVEGVLQVDEGIAVGGRPAAPGGGSGLRDIPVGLAVVAIPVRQAAPHRALRTALLAAVAGLQQRTRGQVGRHRCVHRVAAHAAVIDPAVAIGVLAHHARTHAARGVQRRRHVAHHAALVPAADAGLGPTCHLPAVGMLAHQVDRRRRVPGAGHQAGGAAHDLDAVVDRQAGGDFAAAPLLLVGGRQAIDLQVVDLETARRELGAVAFILVDRDAGGVVDDVGHGLQALVFDALQRHHRYRLRRLAQRQVQRRGGAGRTGGVRIRGPLGADLHLLDGRIGVLVLSLYLCLAEQRHGGAHQYGESVELQTPGGGRLHVHRYPIS